MLHTLVAKYRGYDIVAEVIVDAENYELQNIDLYDTWACEEVRFRDLHSTERMCIMHAIDEQLEEDLGDW